MSKKITMDIYNEISKEDKLIVLDFYADWCNPCKTISPIIDELTNQFNDVNIYKVDVDDVTELSEIYGIRNIPAVLFIKNGNVVDKQIGAAKKEVYIEKINKLK